MYRDSQPDIESEDSNDTNVNHRIEAERGTELDFKSSRKNSPRREK